MSESMSETSFVIVGGDAAGMSAAAKIKRERPDAQVIVFEKTQYISYSACGMPYWIGGVVESDRQLLVMTPEIARKRRGIDVRIHHEVTQLDLAARTIRGVDHTDGAEFSQSYDKLLIATGARPLIPDIPGAKSTGVFPLRAFQDAHHIQDYITAAKPSKAVIVGGGYIGIEMVEALHDRGLQVDLVEMLPQIMPNFDPEMVEPVAAHLQEKGVALHTESKVTAIHKDAQGLCVELADGATLEAGLVIMAVGVQPNSELAGEAGLTLGKSGAITVDKQMCTAVPDVFAAGDCVEHHHLVLDAPAWIPLATSANKGGRIAGENMIGAHNELPGILGTAVVKAFEYTMSTTGVSEQQAKRSGIAGENGEFVGVAVIENKDKVGYWPGAETLKVKLVFDIRDGRILGGQLVGKAGVNKRIDIIATAITAKMTLAQTAVLDLSYAPPYSPTYDPIQICARQGLSSLLPSAA